MSENESLSRRSRHSEKRPGNAGKNVFTLISIVVVIAIAGGAYWFYNQKHQEALAQKQFETASKTLLKEIQEERDQSGIPSEKKQADTKKIKTVVYVPQEADQLPLKDTEKQLTELVDKAKKSVKKDERSVIVGKLDIDHMTDVLDVYKLEAAHYDWNAKKEEFNQKKSTTTDPVYISHKTGQVIGAKDIIPTEADLLGVQEAVQQKILDQAKDKNAIFDKVLTMPRISYNDQFTYTPEELTITLPKNETGVDNVTFKYKEIAAFIDTSLVDQKEIEGAFPKLDAAKKHVALTFDDGPNPETTPRALDILKEKGAKATFFVLGQNVESNQELTKRIHDEGHEVASHSYSHPLLTTLSDDALREEINKTDKAIFTATGVLPKNLRPPYGSINAHGAEIVGKANIMWDIDSLDWKSKNANAVIQQVTSTVRDGSIILLHDIHPTTVDSLSRLIDQLKGAGYELVTVNDLLGVDQKPLYQYFAADDYRLVEK